MKVLGIDIGGTGVKGAPVDSRTGELLAPRFRVATPQPATSTALAQTVAQVTATADPETFPGCWSDSRECS